MIKTSMIIPVYNTAEYLEETFESVFSQTQKEIEVIAINDGSTDNSLTVLQKIQEKHSEMIIFSQENKGLGAARNQGMKLARGEFIYFLDSDDCLVSTAMETCYQEAKTHHLDIVMFDAEGFGDVGYEKDAYDRRNIITDQRSVLSGSEFANQYWAKSFCPSACLLYLSAEFLHKNNLKFLPRVYYEDNEFYCRMLPRAERVMYIPQTLYKRRYRQDSITMSGFDTRHALDYLRMLQEIGRQEHDENVKISVGQVEWMLLGVLFTKCRENDLMKDLRLAGKIFDEALRMCGCAIEDINSYRHIELLNQIADAVSEDVVSQEIKQKIQYRKKMVLKKIFDEVPFESEDACVGIYGTGKYAGRFIDEYQSNIGEIKAEIIFIDSNVISGERKYRNQDILNVNDIRDIPFTCILITSSTYEREIYENLQGKYEDKFRIIRLLTDLHF